jgi:hypothetical protein
MIRLLAFVVAAERRVLGTFAMYFRAPGLPNQTHLRLIDISTHIAAIAITKLGLRKRSNDAGVRLTR